MNRTLENELSNGVRFVFLVQGNDWSNVGKLVFKSSIRFLGSGQKLIECWKAHFQEFDSFTWFKATTDRALESSFSRVRFVFLVQGNDWSKRIELLKMSFPTLDQFLPWTKKTNRTLENELSNIRSVVALNQENESNSWKWAFQRSISRCFEPRKRIELLKMSFPTLDQSLPWTKKTNRTLENELSNARSVVALNQENESNSWKWAFQHSISRCPEPRKRIELLKMSFPTFDQSLPWTIECWKAHFQEFNSFTWFRARTDRMLESSFSSVRFVFLVQGNDFKATTDRMLESSFSRVRFVYLVQGNDWSSVGKLIFKSSIRFLGSGQRLIECWKAHFQEFDSFSWFRATTEENELNSWKWAFQRSISRCPEPRKRIELLKMSFPTFDQSLPWTKKTNRTLENELSNIRSVVALNHRAFESSFSRVRFVFLVQGKDWSNVGKLIFKSSIRLLGSGQRLIERWKAHFQEFDSFSWFRATTDRALESSFSRVQFVFLVQGNDWRKRIELLKMSFPTLDQSLPWTKKTNWTLENELSNARSVVALNQENESNSWKWAFQHSISRCPEPRNESNSWKWAFQHSISRCPEPRKRIELLKMSFPTFDQSLPWTKKTNRTLENELSNIRSVVALNQENESNSWKRAFQHSISRCPEPSNVGKLVFKSSIRFLGSGQGLIECWKAHFQEFDSFSWFRARTDRMLESSFSSVRFVFLVQGNDWSSVGKLIFKSSIRFLGSGQRLIERWKAHFQEFDSFSWFRATTSRQRVIERWKLVFKSSIRFLGSGQRLIERWKAHFQEFDSFPWFRATTDRMLESSFSRVRFVFLVQGKDWSNVGKLIFKSSIRFLGSGQRLKETNRTLENELSNARSVVALNQENESNSWKWAFQHSISPCPEPRKRIELLKMSFPTFDQSLPWTKKTNRTLENELSNIRSVLALNQENESNSWKWAFQHSISRCPEPSSVTTDQMLESSFSRVRFVFLVQGNDWSSVGKLVFKSLIRLLGSGQRLIECWEAHFQEFDSFSWFRATTDRMLESSFSRVRFVFLVQGKDWSSVGKLVFKSSIRFLGSGQRLIECWKAHFQEFDSFSWFRATTDRALESSFSRVRFVFLVQGNDWSSVAKLIFKSSIRFLGSGQRLQGNDWSSVGKLIFKSSIRFIGSGQRLIECWKAHFQEFDSFSWFRATTDRMLESSFSRVRFVFLVQGNDWRKRIELLKMSFPTFDQSLPWTKKTNRTLENELSNIRSVVALNQENESNSWKWAFQRSISRCPEPRKRIELLKTSFPTFDQSLLWTKKTNQTLENELSNIRSVVALNQVNESNSWKWAFQHSISRCPEPRKRIELLKMSFPTLDQSLPWTKKTNRTLENELSNTRSVLALNQENESNSWKRAFQHSISRCPEPRKRIELLKMSFPTLDQSLPWTKKTNRTLENELSNARSVVALNQENESNSWKWAFQRSISRCPEPRKRIELLKMSFPTLDQSLPWTKKTNRTLENELSNIRSVVALNQENESNSWKWAFQHSISRCPEPRKRIELLKTSFPTFDQSLLWTKKMNRTLENELSNIRSVVALNHRMLERSFSRVRFVYLVQGNDWSNVGKLIFKSSIRFLGSEQRLIECWKARFQEFDSFSWFRATTDRMLESSFSRVRFVFLVQGNDWRKRIELLKTSFPTFDQSLLWTKKTNRTLENELSNIRSVVALNQENESNSWKWAFQHSISRCPEPRKRIELLKTSFPTFDQSLPWTKKTNRTLENELSNIRSVLALNQENESNSWKRAFQHSISRCPEPRKRIELLKMSFPTFDQSLPWTKKTNRTLENELSNIRSVVALNHRALESSFSRVRFIYLVQGNDWSSVGKLVFKSSIHLLGSGQRLIECWKAHFQEFDSFTWFRATTEVNESNSWKRAFQRSSIRFLGSGQRLIECWKARFQEFDSFSWFRAKTDRVLESSFSRVRFVYLVQSNDWSSVGKLIFKSSIRFLGSGQRLK